MDKYANGISRMCSHAPSEKGAVGAFGDIGMSVSLTMLFLIQEKLCRISKFFVWSWLRNMGDRWS